MMNIDTCRIMRMHSVISRYEIPYKTDILACGSFHLFSELKVDLKFKSIQHCREKSQLHKKRLVASHHSRAFGARP